MVIFCDFLILLFLLASIDQIISHTPKHPPPPHPRRCPPTHCQSNPPVTIPHFFPQSQIPCRYYRMDTLTLLLENSITIYSGVVDTPAKQLALRKIPSTTSTGLQKNMKNTESYKFTQTQPSHLPQGSGTYPITMTLCKHTCNPSTN